MSGKWLSILTFKWFRFSSSIKEIQQKGHSCVNTIFPSVYVYHENQYLFEIMTNVSQCLELIVNWYVVFQFTFLKQERRLDVSR